MEQARKLGIRQFLKALDAGARRNGKQLDAYDWPGVDPLEHDVSGSAEFRRLMMDGKMRGAPSGKMRRPRMKVISAVAESIENLGCHHDIRCECDEPGASKQPGFERRDIGAGRDRPYGQLRIMALQDRRQNGVLHLAGEQNDRIKHG